MGVLSQQEMIKRLEWRDVKKDIYRDIRERVESFIKLNSYKNDEVYDSTLYFIGRNIKQNMLLSLLTDDVKSTLIKINRELHIAESINYMNSNYTINEIKELHEMSLNLTEECNELDTRARKIFEKEYKYHRTI